MNRTEVNELSINRFFAIAMLISATLCFSSSIYIISSYMCLSDKHIIIAQPYMFTDGATLQAVKGVK